MNASLCGSCLFEGMLTAHSSASSVSIQSCLYQMSYCSDVRDVVDIKKWE